MPHCLPPLFLVHSAHFALCPLWTVLSIVSCPAVMRFVSLRLNSPCWLHSRTPSLWASPVSWGQPVLVAVLLLQFQAHLWFLQLRQHPQRLLQRPRSVMRWRPLCCAPRHSGPLLLGRALALAHLCLCRNALHGHHVAAPVSLPVCVALLPSRSRDWSRAWPPRVARQSHLPSCTSHALLVHSRPPRQNLSRPPLPLDPPLPQLLLLRPPVLRSLRPTLTTNGTRSLTHTVSLALRPPSTSRLLPLELVGVLATSVADVSARQPSAPCGEIFNTLSPVLCVFSAGVASLVAGFVLVCAHFRGSCGSVRGRGFFLWSWYRTWASCSGAPDAGWGGEGRLATLRTWRSSTSASTFPETVCAWWSSSWWPPCWRRAFTGAGFVALGRLLHVRGFGYGMWCHDEAHRIQHHRLHEERFSRL